MEIRRDTRRPELGSSLCKLGKERQDIAGQPEKGAELLYWIIGKQSQNKGCVWKFSGDTGGNIFGCVIRMLGRQAFYLVFWMRLIYFRLF